MTKYTFNRVKLLDMTNRELATFRQRTPRSAELVARGKRSMPKGVPMSWMYGLNFHPSIYVDHGAGPEFFDADQNRYLDFNVVDLAVTMGFDNPHVREAMRRAMEVGPHFLLPVKEAMDVTEELARRTGVPYWQFTMTATGANTEVLRIARTITKRTKVLVFEGHYHGHLDDTMMENSENGVRPYVLGLPRGVEKGVEIVPFNDLEAVEAVLKKGEVALILTEPAMSNCTLVKPEPGFIEALYQLAHRYGTLLCLDEAHDFSFAYGGLTGAWKLPCDFMVLGKGLGTGIPFALYGMSESVNQFVDAHTQIDLGHPGIAAGGTTYANTLSVFAAKAALEKVLTPENYARTDTLGRHFAAGLQGIFDELSLPWHAQHLGPRVGYCLSATPPKNGKEAYQSIDVDWITLRKLFMANRGVWDAVATAGPQVSFAHTQTHIDEYLTNARSLLRELCASAKETKPMNTHKKFYINGAWVDPVVPATLPVINPATEEAYTSISVGTAADVDRAVAAAKAAFPGFAATSKAERVALLRRILAVYNERSEDIARAVSEEMGAPIGWARDAQTWAGRAHLEATIDALEKYEFEEQRDATRIVKEGIGVAALITPWNWPLNQIVTKVAPAIAAGCTVVLKPSEIAPISAIVFSEVMHAAGTPPGVYNMINGDGPNVGQVMAGHPDVDMVSFTGSTRAGVIVAKTAADTVKRVTQELGGKSANIILDDADIETAVRKGVEACFANTGQSCDAPTRMLVPRARHAEALRVARETAATQKVGDPNAADTVLGPVVSELQYYKIQRLIDAGIREGATLVCGGTGRPEGLNRGYYVRPTIFGDVTPQMTIAREEIFGPVLSILPYDGEADAVRIANDTVYGLAAYIQSGNLDRARRVARQMRAGQVSINYADWNTLVPFGGYKQSGNGREYAEWGIHEFLEVKALIGYGNE